MSNTDLRSDTLEQFRVGLLNSLYYVPDYVAEAEEASLLREVQGAKARWTQVSGRRLQSYGGSVTPKGLLAAKLPAWLAALGARMVHDTDIFGGPDSKEHSSESDGCTAAQPNHVLVNAYKPGDGIMAHEDGPAYFPGVCILSLGAPAVMRFRRKPTENTAPQLEASVALMPRSLLVFKDEAYTDCLHGIDAVQEDVLDDTVVNPEATGLQAGAGLPRSGERVSLTVRRVTRVMKALRL